MWRLTALESSALLTPGSSKLYYLASPMLIRSKNENNSSIAGGDWRQSRRPRGQAAITSNIEHRTSNIKHQTSAFQLSRNCAMPLLSFGDFLVDRSSIDIHITPCFGFPGLGFATFVSLRSKASIEQLHQFKHEMHPCFQPVAPH